MLTKGIVRVSKAREKRTLYMGKIGLVVKTNVYTRALARPKSCLVLLACLFALLSTGQTNLREEKPPPARTTSERQLVLLPQQLTHTPKLTPHRAKPKTNLTHSPALRERATVIESKTESVVREKRLTQTSITRILPQLSRSACGSLWLFGVAWGSALFHPMKAPASVKIGHNNSHKHSYKHQVVKLLTKNNRWILSCRLSKALAHMPSTHNSNSKASSKDGARYWALDMPQRQGIKKWGCDLLGLRLRLSSLTPFREHYKLPRGNAKGHRQRQVGSLRQIDNYVGRESGMIAKLHDEISRSWLLFDNVKSVKRHIGRYRLDMSQRRKKKEAKAENAPGLLVEELPYQNPKPKDWEPHHIYLDKLILVLIEKEDWDRSFKVVSLFIDNADGTETCKVLGFSTGYLLNGDGKTIEAL